MSAVPFTLGLCYGIGAATLATRMAAGAWPWNLTADVDEDGETVVIRR